jgi:sugar lactone lactonase YvrE
MTKRRWLGIAALALVGALGLVAATSPIDPVAWIPPAGPPSPPCAKADALPVRPLVTDLPATPDGLAFAPDGKLLAALADGSVAAIDPANGRWQIAARTTRPAFLTGLTVTPDNRIFAVDEAGGRVFASDPANPARLVPVLDTVNGKRIQWANDIATDGTAVVFSTTSQRRNLDQFFNELLEHRSSGLLVRLDPKTQRATLLRDDMAMTNGVAWVPGTSEVLVVETSEYRVSRFDVRTPGGRGTLIATNLPGFPGNIRSGDAGRYWLTLLSPRNAMVDRLAGIPVARRLMAQLPASARPSPTPFPCLIALNQSGDQWKTHAFRPVSKAALPSFSTAIERGGLLYLAPAGMGNKRMGQIYVGAFRSNLP